MAEPNEALKVILAIQPGSAVEKPLRVSLPQDKLDLSIVEAVRYAVNEANLPRAGTRIAEAIKVEMAKEYGITANEQAVSQADPIRQYLTERELEGTKYLGVDLVVASKQTGGLEQELYRR